MTATQVGYGDEGVKLYELQIQGDRIPGAFFRMKGGVRRGEKNGAKWEKSAVLSRGCSGVVILTRNSAGMLEGWDARKLET